MHRRRLRRLPFWRPATCRHRTFPFSTARPSPVTTRFPAARILGDQILAQELLGKVFPLHHVEFLANAQMESCSVPPPGHFLRLGATQHLNDVADTKTLARAQNTGKKLLGGLGQIVGLLFTRRRQAVVTALALSRRIDLAKVGQQRLAATTGCLGPADHRFHPEVAAPSSARGPPLQ